MNLKQMTGWGKSQPSDKKGPAISGAEKCLTMLVEGTALSVPEVDAKTYREFRSNVGRLALQIQDLKTDEEATVLTRTLLHELENYRVGTENALRERATAWRTLVKRLVREQLAIRNLDASSPDAEELLHEIATLSTAEQIQSFGEAVGALLRTPVRASAASTSTAPSNGSAPATANARAASGEETVGGTSRNAAVEQVKAIKERGGLGCVVLFRLGCLEVIDRRFGSDAVKESIKAVAAFLANNLRSDDKIYPWGGSALLGILPGRASEQILTGELDRIVNQERDTTVNVGGKNMMVRVPISFELTSVERLRSAEEMLDIPWLRAVKA